MLVAGRCASGAELFFEGFEDLEMGPYVSISEMGGDGTDWTDSPPPGWSRNNTTTPKDGPVEFYGWTFHDFNSWLATSGDQERSMFAGASGKVAVADADEYDDGPGTINPDQFTVFLQTPTIDLSTTFPDPLLIVFDSSFRPAGAMEARVDVSFDGGSTFANALTYNSSNSGGDSALDRIDENVVLVNGVHFNSTGDDLVVRFGLANAGNDWWWAIDNVAVFGQREPAEPMIVSEDLGVLSVGSRVITGNTKAGSDNASRYSRSKPSAITWGNELVYQFTLETAGVLSVSDSQRFKFGTPEYFLLKGLRVDYDASGRTEAQEDIASTDLSYLEDSFGVLDPGTYYLSVDSRGDVSTEFDINLFFSDRIDTDGDGILDEQDPDDDNDGIEDGIDLQPLEYLGRDVQRIPHHESAVEDRTVLSRVEPIDVVSTGGIAVWEWVPASDGWYDIHTFGSSVDTKLTVYRGESFGELVWLAGNDDAYPGRFAADVGEGQQPDRSAVILPLSAGRHYQFVVEKSPLGGAGGSLALSIDPIAEPVPPGVEIHTYNFDFSPRTYDAGTALIDTIVPNWRRPRERYVHIVGTESSTWHEASFSFGDEDERILVTPIAGEGSTFRASEAYQLSEKVERTRTWDGDGISSAFAGPYMTVASAVYPHAFGRGYASTVVNLKAEGGQGWSLTQMPFELFGSQGSDIPAGKGGIAFDFEVVPDHRNIEYGFTLTESHSIERVAMDPEIHVAYSGSAENVLELNPTLVGYEESRSHSVEFHKVPGYAIVVARDGVANAIENGNELSPAVYTLCEDGPGNNLGGCDGGSREVRVVNQLEILGGKVGTISVKYVHLDTCKDTIGQIVDGVTIPSPLIELPVAGGDIELNLIPDKNCPIGRFEEWRRSEGSDWLSWGNYGSGPSDAFYPPEGRPVAIGIFDDYRNTRIPIAVSENADAPRRAWVEFAGRRWEIQQAGKDSPILLDQKSINLSAAGVVEARVAVSNPQSLNWTAESTVPDWIQIIGIPGGMSDGEIRFRVLPHPGTIERVGTLVIGGNFLNVFQEGIQVPLPDLTVPDLSSGIAIFTFYGAEGLHYSLEFSKSMEEGGWEPVLQEGEAEQVIGMGEDLTLVDPDPPTGGRGFYRVRVVDMR